MDISFMTVLKLFYFICSYFLIFAAADNLGFCSDPFCKVPVGTGFTLQGYNADEPRKLSFSPNQVVEIFVKDYGEKKNLVGVSLNGKRGFIPQTFIKETSTKIKQLVPAEVNFGDAIEKPPNSVQESQIPNEDVYNHIPDAITNNQAYNQDHQNLQENSFKPTESLVSNENLYISISSQAHPPSSESYFDSQLGGYKQQASLTQPPQQYLDTSITTNIQQQFSHLEASYSPPLQSTDQHLSNTAHQSQASDASHTVHQQHVPDMGNTVHLPDLGNTAHQQHWPDVGNTAHQQHVPDVGNTAHQQHVPDVGNTAHQQHVPDVGNTAHQQHVPDVGNTAHQQHVPDVEHNAHVPDVGNTVQVPDVGNTVQQHHLSDVSNTAHQQHAGNTAQQHHVSDVLNTAQQHVESPFPSQNSLSNTEIPMHHSMNMEQMMSPQYNLPNHPDQFMSENTPVQQHFSSIQDSFSSQSFGSSSVSSFPPSSLGETNGPGITVNGPFSNHLHSDSAIPNVASDVNQSPDSLISQQNLGNILKEPPMNPPNNQKFSDDNDPYQFTMKLLENQGYDTDEYKQDYSLDTSSDHPSLDFSSDIFQQSKGNPSFQPRADESYGNVHQVISPTHVVDKLRSSASLDSSFQSSFTQLKSGYSAEETSPQKSDISGVTSSDEHYEDDDDEEEDDEDEVDIEDESDGPDTETVSNHESENDQKSESEMQSDETLNEDINSHSVKSASLLETQSAYKSSKQLDVYTVVEGVSTVPDMSTSQDEFHPPPTEFNETDSIANNNAAESNESTTNSIPEELTGQLPTDFKENVTVQTEDEDTTKEELIPEVDNSSLTLQENTTSKEEIKGTPDIIEEKSVESQNFSFDNPEKVFIDGNVAETDDLSEKEQEASDKIMNNAESSEDVETNDLNPYQIRNLKEDQESKNSENVESSDERGDNVTYPEDDEYSTLQNSLEAIRSFIEECLAWIPEPFYSMIRDLEKQGISPRVPVFTALCSVPCILLIIGFVYIKESSKEKNLTIQLAYTEKNVFTLSAEKNALEENLKKTAAEFESTISMLKEERKTFDSKTTEVVSLKQLLEKANLEIESNMDEINTLKEREKDYKELVKDHEKIHLDLMEEKSSIENKVADQEDYINKISDQLEEKENEITSLQKELEKFKQSNEDYEEKLSQLQTNCNQLLKEAEVWNMRVNELNSKLSEETSAKEELQNSLELKDAEVKSLTNLVQTFKSFEEISSDNEDEHKSNEDKLKSLIDSSSLLIQLNKQEEESKLLSDKLSAEKEKILEMEVGLLESKSEIDKLKVNYNQALQDKTEATTKLEVLTNYFKDKELMLQKQLGAQEAFREKREKDADSAERQIVLIEQENSSYKYQVASMKQEMEETERNLKTQIATQEKKAHENWIAARAAERKLEDMKQEVTQLRQRLTLLEREQDNWVNSSRDDIIRPIPKRISGMNDESINGQDINNPIDPRHVFPPPPPMMLPPDRPLPPLPPLPPFLPPMEPPPFRPQPWHHMDPEFRMTPPDFMRGREVTPPRGRHSMVMDGDLGPLQSSPLGDMRESRNSTPPHSLPDFHDIPPQRPFFPPPPGHHPRYPMPPPYRREFAPGQKRTDNQSDNSSMGRGAQPAPSSQENWSHNSRA